MVVVMSYYIAHQSFVQVFRLGEINAPIIFSMPPLINITGYTWDQAGILGVVVFSFATIPDAGQKIHTKRQDSIFIGAGLDPVQ